MRRCAAQLLSWQRPSEKCQCFSDGLLFSRTVPRRFCCQSGSRALRPKAGCVAPKAAHAFSAAAQRPSEKTETAFSDGLLQAVGGLLILSGCAAARAIIGAQQTTRKPLCDFPPSVPALPAAAASCN
ncbi:hypothetical protein [Kingella potus]|uniref:hypothetical protein n=1 Tax=Kingella potus TaxID=265175 RepID=UPI001FD4AC05|nr:hypothetical protein [Kingella potus]UOP00939.1 hypothetical protein LVJ84_00525 [Kingella potus]